MASTTSNIGLTKPAGTDKALVSVINSNSDIIDSAAGGLMDAIAIVANGNTHAAISAGQYVYVHNHGTLAEGLYTANSAIAANATLSTSNLTADASGGLNALNSNVNTRTSIVTSITVHQNLTPKHFHAYKCGKVVWIDGCFQVTGNITNGQALLDNLPTSGISNTDQTTFLCPVKGSEWGTTPTKWHFQLVSGSRILNGTTTLSSGDYIEIQRTYIAE